MLFGEQGQAALRDEFHAAGGHGFLDRLEIVIEPDAEIRIVPGDARPFHPLDEKAQVLAHLVETKGLVFEHGIDAEIAGIGASGAPDHGHHLDERRLRKGCIDELPALAHAGQIGRLLCRADVPPLRAMRRAVRQHVRDHRLVGQAEDIVEIERGVFRIAAGVRPAEDRDRAVAAKQRADRIGELAGKRERADNEHIGIVEQLAAELLHAGVAHEPHVMAELLAPHTDDLRHDGGEIRVHDARIKALGRPVADEIDNRDFQPFHARALPLKKAHSNRSLSSKTACHGQALRLPRVSGKTT